MSYYSKIFRSITAKYAIFCLRSFLFFENLPLLGILPLLSIILGSTQTPGPPGADVEVVRERDGCLSDLERISVRRLAAISDLVSPKQLSLPFRWLLTLTFAPRAEFRRWMRDSLGFNILLVLAARFNDLYSDFVGAQGIFFPNIYLNEEEIKTLIK